MVKQNPHALPFTVHPLEDNFLEWHFTLAGPIESDYTGGLYHGRLQFPADYPFTPPNLFFLTANGRWQVNTKICLSVTGFHPEAWQPAWGARTMLMAIRDHMCGEEQGAIGSLTVTPAERRHLARLSQAVGCKLCGYCAPMSSSQVQQSLREDLNTIASIRRPPSASGFRPEFGIVIICICLFFLYNYLHHA